MSVRPNTQHTDVVLLRALTHLNSEGVDGRTAEAHLTLQSGDQITIRAGGPGIHSMPAAAPFTAYEVLSSSDTEPKYWRKYTDGAGVVFANVPALLIAHYVHRSGGISDYLLEVSTREVTEVLNVRLAIDQGLRQRLLDTLASVKGVEVMKASVQPQMG